MGVVYGLGIMTGTSCDGADFALMSYSRKLGERLIATASIRFPSKLRLRLRNAQKGLIQVRECALLTRDYSRWLGDACNQVLKQHLPSTKSLVFIAAHGQTIWHMPEESVSVQLCDAATLVTITGKTVVFGFRQPDLAAGGQGAPLVPYYHWLRATELQRFKEQLPFAIHNIGGIANVTYLSKKLEDVVAFDTGPGNALIDLATEQATKGKIKFDRNGLFARQNEDQIDWAKIKKLVQTPFFKSSPPKSTGRELFSEIYLRKNIPGKGKALIANATALTAYSMAQAYEKFLLPHKKVNVVYIAGGGALNKYLLDLFQRTLSELAKKEIQVAVLPQDFAPAQHLEAMAFARLGAEALLGRPVSLPSVTGARTKAYGVGVFCGPNYETLSNRLSKLAKN